MTIFEILYLIISILAAIICGGIGYYMLKQRKDTIILPFSGMMFLIAFWIIAQLLSVPFTDANWILFWTYVRFFPIAFVPYVWMLFSLSFFLSGRRISKKIYLSLAIVPALTQLMVWTNPLHHWVIQQAEIGNIGAFYTVTEWQWGPWFWIHAFYSYLLILNGIVLIIHSAAKYLQLYRGQAILLITSVLFPILITILQTLQIYPISLDLTPIAFSIMGIVLFWNISTFHFSNILPIEKEKLIEFMRDGMIIINQRFEILDINPAALSFFHLSLTSTLGKDLLDVFPFFHYPDSEEREVYDIKPKIDQEIKHFEIISSPIQRDNFDAGWLILIRDTTEKTLVELAYKDVERRLNRVIHHSHDGIIIADNQGKIIVWNKSIERLLNTKRKDMLGCYLWDIIPRFTEKDQIPSGDYEEVKKEIQQSLVTGKSSLFNQPLQIRLFSKNEKEYYADVIMYSIKAGKGFYICLSEHNITEQMEARQALQRAYDTLEEQVKERTAELENLMNTLEQRIQDRTKDLSILYQISAAANQYANPEEMLRTCLEIILNAIHIESGTIHLYNAGSQKLSLIAHRNLKPEYLISIQSLPANGNIFSRVIQEGNTITAPSESTNKNEWLPFSDSEEEEKYTYIGTLMKAKGKSIGVLSIFQPESQHFSIEQIALLTTISEQLGMVIENHELQRNAETLAVMEERQRLARDLHDSVTQRLYSLMLYASAGKKAKNHQNWEKVSHHLEQIDQNAQQALREMRLLINELRPDILEKEGFLGAIQHRLDFVEKKAGVDYVLHIDGNLDLSHQEEEELFHILTEALNNALKHANASKIKVSIQSQPSYFRMELWDNGTGFNQQAEDKPKGYGFISMRERAEKIGGRLTIQSTVNSHTSIIVELGDPSEAALSIPMERST